MQVLEKRITKMQRGAKLFTTEYLGEQSIQLSSLFGIAIALQHNSYSKLSLPYSHACLTAYWCTVIHMYIMHKIKIPMWQSGNSSQSFLFLLDNLA